MENIKRPSVLTPFMDNPSDQQLLAYDKAFGQYKRTYENVIKYGDHYQADNHALIDGLIALSVYLVYAGNGELYE